MLNPRATRIAAAIAAIILPLGVLGTSPAYSAPPDPTTAPAPVDLPVAADPPPTDLREAVERDLGLTWDSYLQQGAQAEQAATLDEQLSDTPGYEGVSLAEGDVVVSGTGTAVETAARAEQARTETPVQTLDEDSIRAAYARFVDAEHTGLLAIGWTGEGWLVTVTDPEAPGRLADGSPGTTPQEFAAANPGLAVRAGALPTPNAEILGGQGWGASTRMPRCSIGFAAFGPDGRQAMITAGHCSDGGALTEARWERDPAYSLGSLAFTQFGSADNSATTSSAPGGDISVYAGAHGDLLAGQDSYAGVSRVTGTTAPVAGAPVCTSGRSTQRWQCTRIESVGSFAVQGPGGAGDIRWIRGLTTRLTTRAGDSGAGMVTGLKAVGVISAGIDSPTGSLTYGALLDPALARGFSLEVWLNEPSAAPSVGGRVRGRIPVDDSLPPGTSVRWDTPTGGQSAAVNADGTFDIAAPDRPVTLVAANGPSRSVASYYDPRYGTATSGRFCGLLGGGCIQRFTGGTVYWTVETGQHLVRGRIFDRWGSLGYENGALGYPTSGEMCGLRGGGCWQTFTGGRIYWSPATDAHPVVGAIGEGWNGTGYETGFLGYPTSAEFCGLRDNGCFQRYEGGVYYWSRAAGAQWTRGSIHTEWGRHGWETGFLGYPTSPEFCDLRDGGCFQRYEGGSIYWSGRTGAHWTRGAIRTEWGRLGWENGQLGYPVSGEFCGLIDGGCFQRFAGGSVYWSATTGAHPVWGAIREYWGTQGWETGWLGYPLGGEQCGSVNGTWTCTQSFEGGQVIWTPTGGAR